MNELNTFFSQYNQNPVIMALIVIWIFVWKGLSLWKAARKDDKWWFVALLVINLLGVLEIFYYFVFSERKSLTEKEK